MRSYIEKAVSLVRLSHAEIELATGRTILDRQLAVVDSRLGAVFALQRFYDMTVARIVVENDCCQTDMMPACGNIITKATITHRINLRVAQEELAKAEQDFRTTKATVRGRTDMVFGYYKSTWTPVSEIPMNALNPQQRRWFQFGFPTSL